MTTQTLTTEQRDVNIERIARQHAEAIVAHANHINGYDLGAPRFDNEVCRISADIRQALYRTDAHWLADQQIANYQPRTIPAVKGH